MKKLLVLRWNLRPEGVRFAHRGGWLFPQVLGSQPPDGKSRGKVGLQAPCADSDMLRGSRTFIQIPRSPTMITYISLLHLPSALLLNLRGMTQKPKAGRNTVSGQMPCSSRKPLTLLLTIDYYHEQQKWYYNIPKPWRPNTLAP